MNRNKPKTFIYRFAVWICQTPGMVFFGLLLLSALLSTAYSIDMESQKVLFRWDNLLLTLPLSALLLGFFFAVRHWTLLWPEKHLRLLRIGVLLWILLLGGFLILFGKTAPAADSLAVYWIAGEFANGNFDPVRNSGSYLAFYPQQFGLIAYFQPIIFLWNLLKTGLPAYHFLKVLNVFWCCVIVHFQEKTGGMFYSRITSDDKAEAGARSMYLALAALNVPLIFYSSFVYSEIPSFAAITIGLYFLERTLMHRQPEETPPEIPRPSHRSFSDACVGSLFIALGVLIRKNNLILLIALLIVLCFELEASIMRRGRAFRKELLLALVLCGGLSFSILPLTQRLYENMAGVRLGDGVSAISYLAMGMQESSRAEGWYNGFNFDTYQRANMDRTIDAEISRAAIAERRALFRENPGYAIKFYLHKYLSQWADGSYAARQATLATYGGRIHLLDRLYEGDLSFLLIEFCNLYQNVLYLGAFLFLWIPFSRRQKQTCLAPYLGMIAVFGGFLFHMLWEANSRYIFLYGMLLLPYAACGLSLCFTKFRKDK